MFQTRASQFALGLVGGVVFLLMIGHAIEYAKVQSDAAAFEAQMKRMNREMEAQTALDNARMPPEVNLTNLLNAPPGYQPYPPSDPLVAAIEDASVIAQQTLDEQRRANFERRQGALMPVIDVNAEANRRALRDATDQLQQANDRQALQNLRNHSH